jgi:uncharacterized protein (TIGR00369 family)
MDKATLIAEGWNPLPTVRYSAALGPTFSRIVDGRLSVCLLAQQHLGNDNLGIVHGGAMMTFGDMALGCAVGQLAGGQLFVTVQLQFQFVAAANVTTLVTCQPEVVRKTSQLVFVRGLIESAGRTVASADGIFKLLDTEKATRLKAG